MGGRRVQRQGGMGNALANEVQRQAFARVVAKTPLADYYGLMYRARSGTLLQPRYIITAVIGLVGVLGAGLVSCLGIIGAWLGLG
jgi:hypothetical protein